MYLYYKCAYLIGCGHGYYSQDCKYQCPGPCKDNVTCNHVTGLCEEGCAAGWKGLNCDSGKVDDMMTWFSLLNNLFFQYFNESIHHFHVCFKLQIENMNMKASTILS